MHSENEDKSSTCPNCGGLISVKTPFCPRCKTDIEYFPDGKCVIQCLYCSSNEITKEHIYGRWLTKAYPTPAGPQNLRKLVRPERSPRDDPDFYLAIDGTGEHPYHLSTMSVCADCNNGWLSAIHIEARASVTALANQEDVVLSDRERVALARWAVMVCANLESWSHLRVMHDKQLQELRQGNVPSGFRIYVLKMMDFLSSGYHFLRVGPRKDIVKEMGGLYAANCYFVIEGVAFNLIYSADDHAIERASAEYNCYMDSPDARMIWPVERAEPDPNIRYNEATIRAICEAFLHQDAPKAVYGDATRSKKNSGRIL